MPKTRSKAEQIAERMRQVGARISQQNTFTNQRIRLLPFVALCAAFFIVWVDSATAASSFPYMFPLSVGSRVVFEGDSLIYGQDETEAGRRPAINGAEQGRSASPLPEYLGELLQHEIQIENRGFPGDRTIDGLERWRHVADAALVFIMYGTNDAMNFGGYPGGNLSVGAYATSLRQLVNRRRAVGAQVVVMTAPPIGVPEWEMRVSPYRAEASRVARELDIPLLDTAEVLSGISDKWVDRLHLNANSLKALAQFLSSHIQITPSKELPHAP